MFQEAFQKRLIIISCLVLAVAGFAAGMQVKSFRSTKMKSAQVEVTVPSQKHS